MSNWRLTTIRPDGTEENFDLRKHSQLSVGDDATCDICIDTIDVPFQFTLLKSSVIPLGKYKNPTLTLTKEIIPSLQGGALKKKHWKTKLYEGENFEITGPATWAIGNVRFSLAQYQPLALEKVSNEAHPLEKQHQRKSVVYSVGGYLGIFLILFLWSLVGSWFSSAPSDLQVQKLTIADVKKIKKPVPVIEVPKEIQPQEVVVAKKDAAPAQTAKAPSKAAGKNKVGKPKDIKTMGLLAIQAAPGKPSTGLKVAASTRTATNAAFESGLGLGKAEFGLGSGDNENQEIERLGSISGESYQGGLGAKVSSGKNRSIQISRKEVEIRGGLDPAVIRQIIEERLAEIRYCYETALLKHQGLAGKVSASWVIQADGAVSNISSSSDEIKSEVLQPCIRERIEKWKFPSPKGGGVVQVRYPFMFNPVGTQ